MEDRPLALKAEMGLIAAPAAEKPKALGAGDEEEKEEDEDTVEAEAKPQEEPPVADAVLLEEFEQLEKKEMEE